MSLSTIISPVWMSGGRHPPFLSSLQGLEVRGPPPVLRSQERHWSKSQHLRSEMLVFVVFVVPSKDIAPGNDQVSRE